MAESLKLFQKPISFRKYVRYYLIQLILFCIDTIAVASSESATESLKTNTDIKDHVKFALNTYGDSILRLSYSYLKNMADAEDVLQETMLQLMRSAPDFVSTQHEKAWLMRVAINISKNKIKYNKHRTYEELSESLASEIPEDLSYVWEAVSELPDKYREVIHLYYQEEMSTLEIASLLNRKDSTIRSLLHRARELLKKRLEEVYDFEE